jgi:hypothetical protein
MKCLCCCFFGWVSVTLLSELRVRDSRALVKQKLESVGHCMHGVAEHFDGKLLTRKFPRTRLFFLGRNDRWTALAMTAMGLSN